MGVGGQPHTPAALPAGMTQSGQVLKILVPPGFDPWAIQLVASCYTDYAIPARASSLAPFISTLIQPSFILLMDLLLYKYSQSERNLILPSLYEFWHQLAIFCSLPIMVR
jgi:hypothetical protein